MVPAEADSLDLGGWGWGSMMMGFAKIDGWWFSRVLKVDCICWFIWLNMISYIFMKEMTRMFYSIL